MRALICLAVAVLVVPISAFACDGHDQQVSIAPRAVTVAEVAKWSKDGKVVPVDANGQQTRSNQGIIPGAVLLTSSSQYDVKELPADKNSKLVFYCANERCGASHAAAARALENGYTDVSVLPAGIFGWKAAGQPVSKPQS